jgi:glycosyltransferase involved in cell wall biosynthesis
MKKLWIALLFAGVALQAHAWGRDGHRIVARIAASRLTPAAAAQVHQLLGSETLVDVAPFADEYRSSHRETGPWHYVDTPSTQATYDRERDCPVSSSTPEWRDCAVDRIPYFVGRLKDTTLSPADRAFALKMVVHLVGDLHQPFHAIGDERGGNGIQVAFFNSPQCGERYLCNLHGIWDEQILEHSGLNQDKYVAHLEEAIARNQWDKVSQANPVVWANESHKLAVSFLVPNRANIDQQYYDAAIVAVDRQLAVAGIRLARILNAVLTPAAQ